MTSAGDARAELRARVGSLLLSAPSSYVEAVVLRALHVQNLLARLGTVLPLFAIHDLLCVLVGPVDLDALQGSPLRKQADPSGQLTPSIATWAELLRRLHATKTASETRALGLRDELLAVVVLRLLNPVLDRLPSPMRRSAATVAHLDGGGLAEELRNLLRAYRSAHRERDVAFLEALVRSPMRLELALEQIDLDTLRLLETFDVAGAQAGALGLLDLHEILDSPEANDVVNFSLDLLPSVLETRRASSRQTMAINGYAGIARKGSLDSLMLSELAFEDDLFDQRYLENELFYYARERANEHDGALHYVCVDASASMRGKRAAFARGLALALVKKLSLLGEEVIFRFFDAGLYEAQHVGGRKALNVPYVLGFRSERGRNALRVFELLADDVERRKKATGAEPVVYLITHAECHAPMESIERLRRFAKLYGIFMLPSAGELDLDYLPLLHRTQVVDEAMLVKREARTARALAIVDDVAKTHGAHG